MPELIFLIVGLTLGVKCSESLQTHWTPYQKHEPYIFYGIITVLLVYSFAWVGLVAAIFMPSLYFLWPVLIKKFNLQTSEPEADPED